MKPIAITHEHTVNDLVAGIHAEGGPPDRAALLLQRAAQELERRRQLPAPPLSAATSAWEEV